MPKGPPCPTLTFSAGRTKILSLHPNVFLPLPAPFFYGILREGPKRDGHAYLSPLIMCI